MVQSHMARPSTTQPSLFATSELLIRDDAEGGIRYLPGFVADELAAQWFAALRADIEWRTERRLMYEREVDVPRLVARYAINDPLLHPALREIVARIAAAMPAPFNSVGLNFYRDGRDSVAMHHDKLQELRPGHPIALLSLGTTRRMDIQTIATPRRRWRLELEPGSLLLMSHRSQLETLHGIPKLADPVGPRISVALRVRPSPAAD
jgi:alkylated DNA repair dioxygenase AlkB